MDPVVLASMIFTLIGVLLIGGFITLFPITRRLGLFLESKYQKEKLPGASAEELKKLWECVRSIESELERLADRQEFTEKLLARRSSILPPAGARDESAGT